MCIIMVAALPGYLPSVRRGLMSNRHAPLSWAIAYASMVLPLPGAPYSSTAFGAGTLHGDMQRMIYADTLLHAVLHLSQPGPTRLLVHACTGGKGKGKVYGSTLSS